MCMQVFKSWISARLRGVGKREMTEDEEKTSLLLLPDGRIVTGTEGGEVAAGIGEAAAGVS